MQDLNGTVRRITRRIAYLRERIGTKLSDSCLSYDKSELFALEQACRIIALYNEARGAGNSHVENVLRDSADSLDSVLDDSGLSDRSRKEIERIRDRCAYSVDVMHRFHTLAEREYEAEAGTNMSKFMVAAHK